MTSGKLKIDDVLKVIDDFKSAHIKPVQAVFIAHPAEYEEAKKLFEKCGVKVVKSESIDPKVVGYLMDKYNAERIIEKEKEIACDR